MPPQVFSSLGADICDGWRIPKGTLVIVNTMAVNKHEDYFPLPEDFAPERDLDEKDPRYNLN